MSARCSGMRGHVLIFDVFCSPGPTRSPRQYAYNPGRSTSTSSFNLRDLQMRSNPSLNHLAQSNTSLGQLAQDFATHANVQPSGLGSGPYGSTSSLGRYAPSSSASMSGPPTPYGHPLSHAVARGDGTGRHAGMLPSIADWEHGHHPETMDEQTVNPMFRVVSATGAYWSDSAADATPPRSPCPRATRASRRSRHSRPLHPSPTRNPRRVAPSPESPSTLIPAQSPQHSHHLKQ